MRKMLLGALLVAGLPLCSQAELLVRATFDRDAAAGLSNYLPGSPGDALSTVTKFQDKWADSIGATGGWLDNQFGAPDIATPATAGPEGGNALFVDSSVAAGARKGYWVQLANPLVNSDFTVELMFSLKDLNPAFAEHRIQNVFSVMWPQDNQDLEMRFFGDGGDLGAASNNSFMVMTDNASGEHSVVSGANALAVNTWYHAAVVYKHATGTVELFLNGTSLGTAATGWTNHNFSMFCLGAWPNPAGSCRDMSGYIDAFAFSNTALDASNFDLTHYQRGAAVQDWQLHE